MCSLNLCPVYRMFETNLYTLVTGEDSALIFLLCNHLVQPLWGACSCFFKELTVAEVFESSLTFSISYWFSANPLESTESSHVGRRTTHATYLDACLPNVPCHLNSLFNSETSHPEKSRALDIVIVYMKHKGYVSHLINEALE